MPRRARSLAACALLAALSACGQAPSSTRVGPVSPGASATPTVAPVKLDLGSTPGPTVAPASGGVGFTCRLPLLANVVQASQAGFISFPAGTFSPDPTGNITPKAGAMAYDRVFSRWLPVDWRFVSDDGTRYTYAVYPDATPGPGVNSVIHVVDVATGRDRVVLATGKYIIVDYTGAGIYLAAWVGGHDGPGPQVQWRLDPVTGALRELSGGAKYGYTIGGGAGWRTDYNTADPTVHQGMTGPNRLIRVDLSTGAEATWLYQQGADSVQVMGFEQQGHPIVATVVGSQWTTAVVGAPGKATNLFSVADTFWNVAVADAHGIWFSGSKATYLYDASHGFRQVSSAYGQIAGGCH